MVAIDFNGDITVVVLLKRRSQSPLIRDYRSSLKELNSFLISRLTNGKEPNCKIEDVIDYEQPTSYIVNSDKSTFQK